MAALEVKRRMKGLLMFLPNMLALCGRLLTDRRVPRTEKALFAGAIVYAIMPFDLLPDMLPFVGQIDDAYLIALVLLRLINRTDESVVRELWRGSGDVVRLAESVASVAPLLLPARVHRVLSSRVEMRSQKERAALKEATGRSGAMLVEVPDEGLSSQIKKPAT
ncbi:MAG: DUF1232 domain-containing protein [Acidobacteria bacterium]|nr:DUF1232 domain-containing protein [Acidobacteriota bacterium]